MMTWAELIDQAMLGTQGLESHAVEWPGHRPEQALLKQVALAGAARRAGFVAQMARSLPTPDPAPPETRPPCSAFAMDWLKNLIRVPYQRELVRDWALVMIQKGKRIPHVALPTVLTLAVKEPQWAPYLLPLVGERGRWLIERTDSYAPLRQADLWGSDGLADLKPADLEAQETPFIAFIKEARNKMMEGLSNE